MSRPASTLAHEDNTLARTALHLLSSGAGTVPVARAPFPPFSLDVAIRDWDDLLCAVKDRLRLTVGELEAAPSELQAQDTTHRVQTSVLECVAALDQLHTTLAHELSRRQELEREVFDAQTALAQAHAELAGTSANELNSRHRASHDGLTSLPNRSCFRERLDRALARAEPPRQALALLYLDLDDFKQINDEHGRDVGDELLRIVAARLTRAVRADDMVGRVGGDEFACLLATLSSPEQLSHLACKLFDVVGAPVKIGKLTLNVHASIGIAICPADGATADALLTNADAAMYRAKRQKTGYSFFDEYADVDLPGTE